MEPLSSRFAKEVFLPYKEFLRAKYRFHRQFAQARVLWEEKLTLEELVNGPYLEKAQVYATGSPLEELDLHKETRETIRGRLDGRDLWKHQTDALKLLLDHKNAVIATGTSSGKTLCFQIPILDDLVRDPAPGLRAIIIYPLNALVNDQLEEWDRMLRRHPAVTFARFTGQTPKTQIDYIERLKNVHRIQLRDQQLSQRELEIAINDRVQQQLNENTPNRLNHREAIRANPPHVLITNFSMLEYLLERPIDAPIFENSNLRFLVLDEAHAYRGVQATEIAFLIRRLKDRLGIQSLTCVATSATLGKPDDKNSLAKVRKFATDIFGEDFSEPNPIFSTTSVPQILQPTIRPSPEDYAGALNAIKKNDGVGVSSHLGVGGATDDISAILSHDENLYRLRKEILSKPTLLGAAAKDIWPNNDKAEEGLFALLELVVTAKADQTHEDLLPTRLHYFIRAQDGLHICLRKDCPARIEGRGAFYVSRVTEKDVPEGECPACYHTGRRSRLVEVVTCRKCGYLFGALQDLGPRRAQFRGDTENVIQPSFDSFDTQLGWAGDSYWSYFSTERDLPFPEQLRLDEDDEDQYNLFLNPARLDWCVICGKKRDPGGGDNCRCAEPHLRKIQVFHRQCPVTDRAEDIENLYGNEKKLLSACPNCGAKNASGIEPLRRFQESDDEMGLAMAIPFAHFQVKPWTDQKRPPRKLLCFTDHRQRAAAFPSLLEEETFGWDMGRKIVEMVNGSSNPPTLVELGEHLADLADPNSSSCDPDFFLPVSRYPDEDLDSREKRNLWIAETFAYFGIPDSARDSAEDFGLVTVKCKLKGDEKRDFGELFRDFKLNAEEGNALLQTLLKFVRQRKVYTLPHGVKPNAVAFGRVLADIAYVKQRDNTKNSIGWLPSGEHESAITDYLCRVLCVSHNEALDIASNIWEFLTSRHILLEHRGRWKLDHERLFVLRPAERYVCSRCGLVTAYSVQHCCPRKECSGTLEQRSFNPSENIVGRWVAAVNDLRFSALKSEEHTAQISKDLAKDIEDEFRAEGINLLSSTTTFEMGINIGDLQKVLLRNAPPTSANYVQRVGRAGRGREKNSVAVTLCRRTKYDGDAWNDPPRLMAGEVHVPAVYTRNSVISKRHFNATAFAAFLRATLRDQRLLGRIAQKIRIESFLSLEFRRNIPKDWFQVRPESLYIDFRGWFSGQTGSDIFHGDAGRDVVEAAGGFDDARAKSIQSYEEIMSDIGEELRALMNERQALHEQGKDVRDVDQSIKNILGQDVISTLVKSGFLPRYAFPLDVVSLETGRSRWSGDSDVELSRDRGLAIAEFAPGAQVIAHKKVFTSAGLYVVSKRDKPVQKWYSKCPTCEQIRTGLTKDSLKGPCLVCQRTVTDQYVFPFVSPEAFSVRVDETQGVTRYRRSTLIRQRQSITHFIDYVGEEKFAAHGLFKIALKESGSLFRYNLGPNNEGFMLCPDCGASEPLRGYRAGRRHKKLRSFSGTATCPNTQPWTRRLAYGHEFSSFCLIARPLDAGPPVETLAYALQRGLCRTLELESSDIGVSWRWLANRTGRIGSEIVLYDNAPGGAGFVKEGYENWEQVVDSTFEICNECLCDTACYDCLKSYQNQAHHEILDRHTVAEFLRTR
jgi:ATP-dependent helicase YprA (DUF1998 family)